MSAQPPASRLRSISTRERITYDPERFARFAPDADDLDAAVRAYVVRLIQGSEASHDRAIVAARRAGR